MMTQVLKVFLCKRNLPTLGLLALEEERMKRGIALEKEETVFTVLLMLLGSHDR